VKLSISLREDDLAILDGFVRATGLPSRSAAVQRAIRLLQESGLEQDYEAAWDEWRASGEEDAWDAALGDGLSGAAR
jgi:Arc/MetJ-type ribon-helix-helix transcriptional regulator